MKNIINENRIKIDLLNISASGIVPQVAILKNIRITYGKDDNGRKTNLIEVILYDCVNADDFSTFTIKVESKKPVISPEELEEMENPLYIEIPVEKTRIKPFEISFGVARVSIIAPDVKLASDIVS